MDGTNICFRKTALFRDNYKILLDIQESQIESNERPGRVVPDDSPIRYFMTRELDDAINSLNPGIDRDDIHANHMKQSG